MYKVLAFAGGSALCLTTASVGGYYMLGSSDEEGSGAAGIGPISITADSKSSLLFDSLDAFKQKMGSTTEGIKEFFGDVQNITTDAQTLGDDTKALEEFCKGLDANDQNAKSYARIEHQKKFAKESSQWWGKFIFLWTFVSKDKGFITFNVLETTNEQKLSFKGVFYILKKEGSGWKVTHRKEPEAKSIDKDTTSTKSFSYHFPNPTHDIKQHGIPENWGFIEKDRESAAFDNMCAGDGCGALKSPHTLSWTLEWKRTSGGTHKPFNWTVENRWAKPLYGSGFEWQSQFPSSFTGIWTLKGKGTAKMYRS